MLYYLRQEVIGEHADSVLRGADARSQPIKNPCYLLYTCPHAYIYTHSQAYTESICLCPRRDIDIWMPEMEQLEVPSGWWDTEADRSLLVGVFKHGVCECEKVFRSLFRNVVFSECVL
jgi:chromodomain helicase DNA binding protein 8